jgi:hypothetical protein
MGPRMGPGILVRAKLWGDPTTNPHIFHPPFFVVLGSSEPYACWSGNLALEPQHQPKPTLYSFSLLYEQDSLGYLSNGIGCWNPHHVCCHSLHNSQQGFSVYFLYGLSVSCELGGRKTVSVWGGMDLKSSSHIPICLLSAY